MELVASGIVARRPFCMSSEVGVLSSERRTCLNMIQSSLLSFVPRTGFSCDDGHLKYDYCTGLKLKAGGPVKEIHDSAAASKNKKRLKLLKGLSKDLSLLSEIVFGMNSDSRLRINKGETISEATKLLLGQLKRLKEDEKNKKKKKVKTKLKVGLGCGHSKESSSCNEVKEELRAPQVGIIAAGDQAETKIIEVCMGSKCKKSGAIALMEEIEKEVGVGVKVVGCKCMGKCRTAPNLKIHTAS